MRNRPSSRLAKEEVARKRADAGARQALQQVAKRIEALDALAPIVMAGVSELHRQRQSLERELGERTASRDQAEAAIGSLPSENTLPRQMLSEAVVEWTEAVDAAAERIDVVKRAVAAFELAQNRLSSLATATASQRPRDHPAHRGRDALSVVRGGVF